MISAKKLVQLNNQKREQLTSENKKYYEDLMVYIRVKPRLSEQHTEEILVELLDHLLEGQKEGRTAKEIFGDNPKGYADELISHLPKEKIRKTLPFIIRLIMNVGGWFLIIRGLVYLALNSFIEIDDSFYLISGAILALVISSIVGVEIWYIFKMIENSLFDQKDRGKWKEPVKIGLLAAAGMGVIFVVTYFLPNLGPEFQFTWYLSLITGVVFWALSRFMEKKGY